MVILVVRACALGAFAWIMNASFASRKHFPQKSTHKNTIKSVQKGTSAIECPFSMIILLQQCEQSAIHNIFFLFFFGAPQNIFRVTALQKHRQSDLVDIAFPSFFHQHWSTYHFSNETSLCGFLLLLLFYHNGVFPAILKSHERMWWKRKK